MSEFDNPKSVYSKSLKAVAEREHKQIQKFQFQKQNKKNGHQLYKMTDVTTGNHVILSASSKLYDKHREPEFNVWIWADTFERVEEDDSEEAEQGGGRATVSKKDKDASKKINRTLSLIQQKHILVEVLFGEQMHPTKNTKIEVFQRNVSRGQGHFYASVVKHLNDSSKKEGPFHSAPATVGKIQDFVILGIQDRMKVLQEKYGPKFMERMDWDTFNDRPTADDEEETRETILKDEIDSLFDALVYGAYEPESMVDLDEAPTEKAYSAEDDKTLADVTNGGGAKRKREHKLEPVKPKAANSVVQFEQRTSAISDMVKSLTSFMTQPVSASFAPSSDHSVASTSSPGFDMELKPLLNSLLALPKPPGTTAICEVLATGLGKYGIISLSELQEMNRADAELILKGLNWSPMQIAKVLP
jgi:hypothetical protein